jgi:hypothetical protein
MRLVLAICFFLIASAAMAAAPQDGFAPLFNGKDLSGWTVSGTQSWGVQEGAIACTGQGHGYLFTDKEYEDFVLRLDYQISKGGNSGIFCHAASEDPVNRGFEVQVLDDYGQEPSTGAAGAIYNIISPYRNVSKPAGEWNKVEITCDLGRITVVMNGVKIVDAESSQVPQLAIRPNRGRISLQNHGSAVKYRNVEIKPLSFDLFNGKDLTGWWVMGAPCWRADNGVLTCSGGEGGWVLTDKEYGDFLLRLEYAISPGGNSGVAVRATRMGNPAFSGMEIQILDDAGQPPNIHGTGSIYGAVAPCGNLSKPANEWNSYAILCQGSHMTVTMNGVKILDVDLGSPALNALEIQERKLKDRVRAGCVGVQNHGSMVRFRNIRINPL